MKKAASGSKSTKTSSTRSLPKLEVDNNSSINVSRIENGFLVSESGYTGKGKNQQYYSKQFYSPTNPVANLTGGKIKFGGKK